MKLTNIQDKLVGTWSYHGGIVQKDSITQQIEWLINNHLKKISTDKSGWDVLYIDPDDERLWELIYPESEMQGGGPLPFFVVLASAHREVKDRGRSFDLLIYFLSLRSLSMSSFFSFSIRS